MKITINPDNLVVDDSFQIFYKVRAIIENENDEFILSKESGKHIFPGGKREDGETNLEAIKREIKEETGIVFDDENFKEVLELEAIYKDYYDFRTGSLNPRYTSTVYYYAKCSKKINKDNMALTNDEISQDFRIAFVKRDRLLEMLKEDHSKSKNGVFFDEENRIILNHFFK